MGRYAAAYLLPLRFLSCFFTTIGGSLFFLKRPIGFFRTPVSARVIFLPRLLNIIFATSPSFSRFPNNSRHQLSLTVDTPPSLGPFGNRFQVFCRFVKFCQTPTDHDSQTFPESFFLGSSVTIFVPLSPFFSPVHHRLPRSLFPDGPFGTSKLPLLTGCDFSLCCRTIRNGVMIFHPIRDRNAD